MQSDEYDQRLILALEALAAGLVDQSRSIEALALSVMKQGRQLRVKIEAPSSKLRGKRRALKRKVARDV
jgi:hypothetical protein